MVLCNEKIFENKPPLIPILTPCPILALLVVLYTMSLVLCWDRWHVSIICFIDDYTAALVSRFFFLKHKYIIIRALYLYFSQAPYLKISKFRIHFLVKTFWLGASLRLSCVEGSWTARYWSRWLRQQAKIKITVMSLITYFNKISKKINWKYCRFHLPSLYHFIFPMA